jgi:hypothetical protein
LTSATLNSWHRLLPWWPAFAIVLALGLGAAATSLWSNGFGAARVTLGEQFGGTLTEVASDGSGVCLRDDATGRQRCSIPMQPAGSDRLRVGEHADVTVATLRIDEDRLQEVFIVTVPASATDNEGDQSAYVLTSPADPSP